MAKNVDFSGTVAQLGPDFAERAAACDVEGRFVADNYAALKREKLLSAAVPAELAGGGASYAELCHGLRELAHYCGSTALALSMHTHLVAAQVWRFRHGQPAEALLRRIAAEQLVLVSTGAGDWVDSVGKAERVEGGYRINAVKRFCSGAPAGDLLITTAPTHDPERGDEVLHFALSLRAKGVSLQNDWDTLGMRGTGSVSVKLEDVFVPDESISLRRSAGQWHPAWSVTMTVAPPIYMAPYVGLAERAANLAREAARTRSAEPMMLAVLGQLENASTLLQMAFREMVELVREYDFEPSTERASQLLIRKTLVANAVRATVDSAVELVGGSALYRLNTIERLVRDVAGAPFHPLPEKKQQQFSARVALGLPPVG